MQYLKADTAATVKLGPFLDETDGKTHETGLSIAQADIRLSKNGGAFAQTNNSAGATHDEAGWYGVPLNTTDTNTEGRLVVAVHESGALPVWREFMVVNANVFDSLFAAAATDYLEVDAKQVEGSDATDQINAAVDAALDTAVPGSPTADSLNQRVKALDVLAEASGDGDLAAIKAKADTLPSGVTKNVALANFAFMMVLSSDHVTPATGKTIVSEISKDGAAFAATDGSVAEIGSGAYKLSLIQAEMNADVVILKFTEGTCDTRQVTLLTS